MSLCSIRSVLMFHRTLGDRSANETDIGLRWSRTHPTHRSRIFMCGPASIEARARNCTRKSNATPQRVASRSAATQRPTGLSTRARHSHSAHFIAHARAERCDVHSVPFAALSPSPQMQPPRPKPFAVRRTSFLCGVVRFAQRVYRIRPSPFGVVFASPRAPCHPLWAICDPTRSIEARNSGGKFASRHCFCACNSRFGEFPSSRTTQPMLAHCGAFEPIFLVLCCCREQLSAFNLHFEIL